MLQVGDVLPAPAADAHPAMRALAERRGKPIVLFFLRAFT